MAADARIHHITDKIYSQLQCNFVGISEFTSLGKYASFRLRHDYLPGILASMLMLMLNLFDPPKKRVVLLKNQLTKSSCASRTKIKIS